MKLRVFVVIDKIVYRPNLSGGVIYETTQSYFSVYRVVAMNRQ